MHWESREFSGGRFGTAYRYLLIQACVLRRTYRAGAECKTRTAGVPAFKKWAFAFTSVRYVRINVCVQKEH